MNAAEFCRLPHTHATERPALLYSPPLEDSTEHTYKRNSTGTQMAVCMHSGKYLYEREKKRHVAMNAFLFKNFGRFTSLPRRGEFDEDSFLLDPMLLIETNQLARLLHRSCENDKQSEHASCVETSSRDKWRETASEEAPL